jgi:hypothetical protein
MTNLRSPLAGIFAAASLFVACNPSASTDAADIDENIDDATGVKFEFSGSNQIASIELVVRRIGCSGESIEPFVHTEHVGTFAGNDVGEVFLELDPGCFEMTATPLDINGIPTDECNTMKRDFAVVAQLTTELGLVVQCHDEPFGGIDVHAELTDDVVAARFTVERVACENESVENQTFVQTIPTFGVPGFPYVNAFFLLRPGCFDVHADPLRANGTPSAVCQSQTIANIVVIDGAATEIGGTFTCN